MSEDIAARGEEAVASLRASAGPVDRFLRAHGPELLDLTSTPAPVKERLLADVERVRRLLLLDRLFVQRVGAQIVEARRTRRGKPVRVLDVGAGHGGLLFDLEDWARRQRIPVELSGVDRDGAALAAARRRAGEEGRRVTFREGVADELGDLEVDVAISTFTLHHLAPGAAACALRELDRVSAVNFFAFDVRRTLVSVSAAWAFFRLTGFDAPTRHDGVVSARRGYSIAEMRSLLEVAGVPGANVRPLGPAYLVVTRA